MGRFYITTAIDYANGSPHLGHAYEKVLTDVVARFRRLMGDEVWFLTGTDEHGQKVQQSAAKEGIEPQAYVDRIAEGFRELCRELAISNDDFIRTTEPRHRDYVREILQKLYDKGEIYQAEYTGFYSVRQEQFLRDKDRLPNGDFPEEFGEVVEVSEPNYFFRLNQYQGWLIDHIRSNDDFIFPRFRQKQVLEFLKEPLNDLNISRPKERLSWGIPLPFDEGYVTYVWFDALLNYVSAVKDSEYWPADYHVIGKDIMVPAHAVYWPIMLKAAEIPLPKSLLVHGFWMMAGGAKMSKSTGNAVNPIDLIGELGADAFRYFVTREMNVGQDSEFSLALYLSRYNSDLGNDLGNLVSRLLNMGHRYTEGKVPAVSVDEEPEQTVRSAWQKVREELVSLYEGFQFHTGLERTLGFVRALNRYAETRAPWKLAKSEAPEDQAKLATSLAVMAEGIRLSAVALTPVMPGISAKVLGLLSQEPVTRWNDVLDWSNRLEGLALGEKTILFPRPEGDLAEAK